MNDLVTGTIFSVTLSVYCKVLDILPSRILSQTASFLFQNIYESIKKEPFKFPEDDGNDLMHTFFNPDKEGWLWKQGTSSTLVYSTTFVSSLSLICITFVAAIAAEVYISFCGFAALSVCP